MSRALKPRPAAHKFNGRSNTNDMTLTQWFFLQSVYPKAILHALDWLTRFDRPDLGIEPFEQLYAAWLNYLEAYYSWDGLYEYGIIK